MITYQQAYEAALMMDVDAKMATARAVHDRQQIDEFARELRGEKIRAQVEKRSKSDAQIAANRMRFELDHPQLVARSEQRQAKARLAAKLAGDKRPRTADSARKAKARKLAREQRALVASGGRQRSWVISAECRAGQRHSGCKGVVAGKDGLLALCSCPSCHPNKAASVKQARALVAAAVLPGSGRSGLGRSPLGRQLRAERRMTDARIAKARRSR